MLLKSTRSLKEMVPVLYDKSMGTDVSGDVYWVFSGISNEWENMTVISPGLYGNEFPKTYGHYHNTDVIEKYKLLSGQGILLMQKRKFVDDDWSLDELEKIYFVEFLPGDEIDITPEWGHSWSNIGREPLVTLDNWKEGHTPGDYEPIERMGGMGYYLIRNNGGAEFVPNSKYKDLPKPEWVSAKEFNSINNEL
jgi:oxalate decarboxylase/phosphoglucose isomerase-like protein (cupin superfamily)